MVKPHFWQMLQSIIGLYSDLLEYVCYRYTIRTEPCYDLVCKSDAISLQSDHHKSCVSIKRFNCFKTARIPR